MVTKTNYIFSFCAFFPFFSFIFSHLISLLYFISLVIVYYRTASVASPPPSRGLLFSIWSSNLYNLCPFIFTSPSSLHLLSIPCVSSSLLHNYCLFVLFYLFHRSP